MPVLNSINQMLNEMTEWRHDLHKIPEIGLEEYETSNFIKNICNLTDFDLVKEKKIILMPIYIPLISSLFNNFIARESLISSQSALKVKPNKPTVLFFKEKY